MEVVFLALDEVLALHADQIDRYGGRLGVRALGLLESALAAPAATFGGGYLHEGLHEMAAAYLFHLVRNHPFLDGNKRTGLMAMLVFLGLNGLRLAADEDELAAAPPVTAPRPRGALTNFPDLAYAGARAGGLRRAVHTPLRISRGAPGQATLRAGLLERGPI